MRTVKSWWLILAFVSGFGLAMFAEELVLTWRNDGVDFSAPRVHFLGSGKPLELLHNAAPVPFDFQLTISSGSRTHEFRKITDRFVVSYDLWEEKFRVVKTQSPRRAADHLTALAAETWCWQQLSEEASQGLHTLSPTEPFWARMEIRAEDGKDGPLFGRSLTDAGISLTSLIEIFSRPPQAQQSRWGPYEIGPLTLDELKRSPRRGP
jgi:hypothetical protein